MEAQPRAVRNYRREDGKSPFEDWLNALRDRDARTKIKARLRRVSLGNLGDYKSVGDSELTAVLATGSTLDKSEQQSCCCCVVETKALKTKISVGLRNIGQIMKNVKMPTSSSYLEYLISSLKDPQEAAAFIGAILDEEDPEPELLRSALQDVAQGLGRAKLPAEQAHQQLEQLDRLFSNSESKVIYSLARWLDALGLKLTVTVKSDIGWQDISTVTNAIAQLPAVSTDEPNLKELLTQLQAVLETADPSALPDADKADALEQVKLLAEAAQKPEAEKKTLGAKAMRFLQRIVGAVPTALPVAATLVTEFNKLAPAIAKLLRL